MIQGDKKFTTYTRPHKPIWLAITVSFVLHCIVLVAHQNVNAPIEPHKHPVIFAELRQQQPQQAQLKQAEVQQHNNPQMDEPTEAAKELSSTNTEDTTALENAADNLNHKPTPTTETYHAMNSTEQSGLAISKDQLSSDPFEREYQQQILAHLRTTLRAPKTYSGSARLEIRFSYRQIATDVRVVISSGNPLFDEWAVQSILKANPFPPVPKELGENYTFRPTLKVNP